jgi:hypothetical protein
MAKRLAVLAVVVLAALQAVPSFADNDDKTGTILLPTPIVGGGESGAIGTFDCVPGVDDPCEKGNFAGLHRRLYLAGGDAVNGIFGVTFAIKAASAGNSFTLSSVPANSADFDITFYKDLGALPNTNPATYCAPAPCSPKSNFAQFGNGNETGKIPVGTRFAIVTCTCVNANFKFDD